MNVPFCDRCEFPIPTHEPRWVIGYKEVTGEGSHIDIVSIQDGEERKKEYLSAVKEITTIEICDTCKKILDSFFALRRRQVLMLRKEMEKLDIE